MPVYRDDREAQRLRAASLRREVERCEGRVTAAFWRCIPDDDAAALRSLRDEGQGLAEGDDDAVTAACDAFERYLRRFEGVLGALDRHEVAWRAVPGETALRATRSPDDGSDAPPHEMTRDFLRAVRALDPSAKVESYATTRAHTLVHNASAMLRVEGAPVSLHLAGEGRSHEAGDVTELRASTTVPRGLPELLVRPETWTESLFRGLRVVRAGSIGDARFDAFFHTECESGASAQVLGAEVRAALLLIASVDVPTLRVRPPLATLTWRYLPTTPTMAAAARCMAAIRGAPVLPLLKR